MARNGQGTRIVPAPVRLVVFRRRGAVPPVLPPLRPPRIAPCLTSADRREHGVGYWERGELLNQSLFPRAQI